MGTPAYSNGYVQFDDADNGIDAYDLFKKWANEQNERKDVDFDISNLELDDHGTGISYTVSSMKYGNCHWQCEEIRDFFIKQKGCQSVEQDVLICENSVNWYKEDAEDEELQEAEEKIKNELGVNDVTLG